MNDAKAKANRHWRLGRLWVGLAVFTFLVTLPTFVRGQIDVSAQLSGTVTDQTGAVIPGAAVIARSQQTNVESKATANSNGSFEFPSLPPGTYTVTCEFQGFKKFVSNDVVLLANQIVNLPVRLTVGTQQQSVTVSASAAMVDTVSATIQTTFQETLLSAVPVFGRDPRETLELLMPGAVPGGTGASTNVLVTSFNGLSGTSNNYRVDGSDFDNYFTGATTPFPQSENIAEFTVTTNSPDASVARGAGGQINAVLKSGTNDLHGAFWTYLENGGWNANSWQNKFLGIRRGPLSQHWFGGNVGGPVYIPRIYKGRNRTFFFTSYEHTSQSETVTSSGQTITNAERQGDFSNSPDGIPVLGRSSNGTGGTATPYINPSTFSTMGKYLAANTSVLPAPTSGIDTFSWTPSQTEPQYTFIARIDEYFSEKHRLFGSLYRTYQNPAFQDMFFNFGFGSWASEYPNPGSTWTLPQIVNSWTINDTYTFSPKMLNNFIFGYKTVDIAVGNTYNKSSSVLSAASVGCGCVGDIDAPDMQEITFPRALGMGIYNGYTDTMNQSQIGIDDNFTIIRGRHSFKMGVDIRQFHETKYQTWDAGGTINFSDGNGNVGGSGNGIADMLLGLTPNFNQNNTQALDIHYPAREAYVQDTYKASPRLTLMLGARWEPYYGVRPTLGNFVTFRPGQASTVFPTAPVGLLTVGDEGVSPNLSGDRWADIGPRASFVWDITGKGRLALHGGYGLFSTYQVLQGFNSYTNVAPYGVSYSPSAQTENLANPYVQYGSVPFPFKAPVAGSPGNSTLVFPANLNTLSLSPNYNAGQVHQWNLTLQFEPVTTYLISVGYVATRGTHLDETHDIDWPQFVPGGSTNNTNNVLSRRPYNSVGFQTINQDNSDYNSLYNSLQVLFSKRMSYGLTFLGNYTLSSNATQYAPRYFANTKLDYFSPGLTQNTSVSFAYELPIPTGSSRLAKSLIGGWQIGGTLTGASGGYGGIGDYSCSDFNFQSAGCYATYVGGNPYASNKGAKVFQGGSMIGVSWLNPNAFVRADQIIANGAVATAPGVGQRLFLGNAAPGVFKGPASFMTSGSLNKDFLIAEGIKLNYRAEAFNALNHTVLGAPGVTTVQPDMSQFGVISSAQNPRQLQMSLRVLF
jgi:hypothetical protein